MGKDGGGNGSYSDSIADTQGSQIRKLVKELKRSVDQTDKVLIQRDDAYNKISQIVSYCEPHIDQMWSATIFGILLGCDFKDAKTELAKRNNDE